MNAIDPAVATIIQTAATAQFGPVGGAGAQLVIGAIAALAARQDALGRQMSRDEAIAAAIELVSHPLPMPVDVADGAPTP